jgi:hypothetical protein
VTARRPGGSEAPYLVVVAFWQETAATDAIAEAVSSEHFPRPDGFARGCVVTFRREVATEPSFRRNLARFQLTEPFDELGGEQ